jgi:hypothetical protein
LLILGFPIRTSPDLRLLASPRGFSQLATSFFAFLRQGIHTHALSSLTIKLTLSSELTVFLIRLALAFHIVSAWKATLQLVVARQIYSIVNELSLNRAQRQQTPVRSNINSCQRFAFSYQLTSPDSRDVSCYLKVETGGAGRDRTGDLLNANQALSQLSYSPILKMVNSLRPIYPASSQRLLS